MKFNQVGVDLNHKKVVSGLPRILGTLGIPLEDVILLLEKHDLKISWTDFVEEGLAEGWSRKTILGKLNNALFETHGIEYRNVVIQRLEEIYPETKATKIDKLKGLREYYAKQKG
jgi:hypothetical protein